ncbi:MAG: DUF2249 domain-containing protein [Actinomycetota bacterium]|nr:MAG: DUF2249 domain-containing protein [Actinomycetota bacterium]
MIATQQEAFDAILAHHEALNEDVRLRVQFINSKVANNEAAQSEKADLISYLNSEVVPHAIAEEHTLYKVAVDRLGLSDLIAEMTSEHRVLVGEIAALSNASSDNEAVEHAARFASLFSQHVSKENELILPKLLDSPEVDLTEALAEMHELFEAAKKASSTKADDIDVAAVLVSLLLDATRELAKAGQRDQAARITASAWASLEAQRPELANKTTTALHRLVNSRNSEPVTLSTSRNARIDRELDVRSLAPAQRHSEIFAAYRKLEPGNGFLLINDHDPKPLQYQFEAEYTGQFTWDYLESGPKTWRVRIGRPVPAS